MLIIVPILIAILMISVATSVLWLPPLLVGLYLVNVVLKKFSPDNSLSKIFNTYHMLFWNKLLFNGGVAQLWFWQRAYNFIFKG